MGKRSDEKLAAFIEVSQAPPTCQAELRALVREGHSLRGMLQRLDEVKKRIAEIVVEEQGLFSAAAGSYGVRDGRHVVVIREQSGRETLNKEALIENGVTPAQIAASLKTGKGFKVVEFEMIEGD